MARQNGDPVLLAEDPDRRLEVQIHPELARNAGSLVGGPCMDTSDPHLLQRHDVRLAGRDHFRNPRRRDLSVRAEPTMDVIGQDPDDPPLFVAVLQRSVPAYDRVDRYAAIPVDTSEYAVAPGHWQDDMGSMDQNRPRFQPAQHLAGAAAASMVRESDGIEIARVPALSALPRASGFPARSTFPLAEAQARGQQGTTRKQRMVESMIYPKLPFSPENIYLNDLSWLSFVPSNASNRLLLNVRHA